MGELEQKYYLRPDPKKLENAKHYLKMMIFAVETRPKGFDYGGVMALVENWLMAVKMFRGEGDVAPIAALYMRRWDLRPPKSGMKRTEQLVQSVKTLSYFLTPGEQNMAGLNEQYIEVRTQMFELVTDFRARLEADGQRDNAAKLRNELERIGARVKARWQ
jgi:hypothetical protein